LSIFALPWLTFVFYIIAPFLLRRSNGMAADISSLAEELDGLGLGLGIGAKGLRKT
jgi:hypothetical protein